MDFLTYNKVSHSGSSTYLSAMKAKLSNFEVNTLCFEDSRIRVYNKTIMRHAPLKPSIKSIIDRKMLQTLAKQCDKYAYGYNIQSSVFTLIP